MVRAVAENFSVKGIEKLFFLVYYPSNFRAHIPGT